MVHLNTLLNKKFTLGDLIGICNPDYNKIQKWRQYFKLSIDLDPGHSNGRLNHAWLQQMICDMSNGLIVYGGQGQKSADCYIAGHRTETKAFSPKYDKFHIAASSFFARNCKVAEYRSLMKKDVKLARQFVFKHSYDKNELYLLSGTAQLNCRFEDITLILIEKKHLISCLEPDFIKIKASRIDNKLNEIGGNIA